MGKERNEDEQEEENRKRKKRTQGEKERERNEDEQGEDNKKEKERERGRENVNDYNSAPLFPALYDAFESLEEEGGRRRQSCLRIWKTHEE